MCEVLSLKDQTRPDELGTMFHHIIGLIEYKLVIFVFISYILFNTTSFVDRILSSWSGAVDGRFPTEKGLLIQAILITLSVAIFSIFVNTDMI